MMAELALAIIPLCLATIKGVKSVDSKLKILRHHGREMRRLRKRFATQMHFFVDECQFLLREIVDPAEAGILMRDLGHPRWSELDSDIKIHLGLKYEHFCDTLTDIHESMDSLDLKLNNTMSNDPNQDVKMKKSEKAREALDMMFHKEDYEELLENFKDSNQELKRILKMAGKMHQQSRPKNRSLKISSLPENYQLVAKNSTSLHHSLKVFWSCLEAQHTNHDVRLLLEQKKDSSMRIVVRYRTQDGQGTRETDSTRGDGPEGRPKKVRRVRFADCATSSARPTEEKEDEVALTYTNEPKDFLGVCKYGNLCAGKNLCRQLCSQCAGAGGYIDAPNSIRHRLSPVCEPHESISRKGPIIESSPLNSVLTLPLDFTLTVPQQLRLALKLVKGVLQFHSTPRLKPYWRLQDLFYFGDDDDLATSLPTLHISTELSNSLASAQIDAAMDDVEYAASDLLDAQLSYGIRNLTMHSLEVALLQIGQWKPLNPDDIVHVRKLASQDSRLGPRYQELTQKCLDCDFGFGPDLTQPKLQSAIYENVVCELEDLINTLEGTGSINSESTCANGQ